MQDQTLNFIKEFLSNDCTSLKANLESLIKEYEKKSKRLDRIIKQSDKQHKALIELNNKITAQKEELDQLHTYNIEQQNIAKEKLDVTIFNSLENSTQYKTQIIYNPSDILSGDFYSIYTLNDGSTLAYILDGQGHGISPALTIFAVSSTISSLIPSVNNFEELVSKLFPMIQKFLGEIEQLSYTMINIDNKTSKIKYASGGTYPFLLKVGDDIQTFKANNLPFMNFLNTPDIKNIDITDWSSLLFYTDGLVEEDSNDSLLNFSPKQIIKDSDIFEHVNDVIEKNSYDDDITVIKICKMS